MYPFMKIAHLITGLGLGGAERQLKALVTDQKNHSLSHIVISLKDEGVIGRQLAGQPGVSLYCLNLHKSIAGLWRLYQILRREKPDVLQTWLYHADLVGLIVGKIARIPHIVWNIRCSNMDLSRYSKITSCVVKALKVLSRFPDAVVTNSQAGEETHAKLGYKPRRWVYIPNGIDTDLFQPNRARGQQLRLSLGIPEEAIVVGMLGRVDPMKDYPSFLKAVNTLSQTQANLYCMVAGKGTEDACWPVVPPRLLRLGMWENAPEFLNSLDIMVLASAFGEGFPNVVGEAMACEVPTVVTDVGDAAVLVQTKAQVVPPQDVDQLILALRGLLALSSQERKVIGQQGRERILRSYSLPVMGQRYALFYKSLR
jgi:glycosyltransferase involved in cell wall biosynthesis